MYVEGDIEMRSYNHCWIIKAISITYFWRVSVALCTQHTVLLRHFVICGLFGCTIFFSHYYMNDTIFGKKKLLNMKCVF